ncbi:MAG: hypothetical protein ABL993_00940 [Vicinamibacterales bacterium]
MSRDASGNYTLPGVVNPVVSGTAITSTWGNSTLADLQTAMTDSLDRNGRGSMLAPLKATDGTNALPSLTFANDTNTGIYRIGTDSIGFATGAVLRLTLDTAGFTSTLPWVAPLGAVGTPSYAFVGDLNTGFYSPGADQIAVSINGVQAAAWSANRNAVFNAPVAGDTVKATAVSGGGAAFKAEGTLAGGLMFNFIENLSAAAGSGTANIMKVSAGSTGDVYHRLDRADGGFWAFGSDTSATNAFKLSAAVTLGTSDVLDITTAGNWTLPAPSSGDTLSIGAVSGGYSWRSSVTMTGGNVAALLENSATTNGASHSLWQQFVGGANAGDVYANYRVSGVTDWSFGLDNSDSDAFKWSLSTVLGTNDIFRMSTTGAVAVVGSAGTLGYGTGAGGTVTQITSKATSVTLNKACGTIVTHNAALAAGATVYFNVANSLLSGADTVVANHDLSGSGGAQAYRLEVERFSTGFVIGITNITAGSLSEALTINFAVIKGATS